MPFRKLPNTDGGRFGSLRVTFNKTATTPPEQLAISEELRTRLNTFYPKFKKEIDERGEALSMQSGATNARYEAEAKCRLFVSHFIHVFNLGVARGVYPVQDRGYYQLDVSQESVPNLNGEENLCKYAEAILAGDIKRVANGGVPMTNPSKDDVKLVFDDYQARLNEQSAKKDNFDKEQKDVDALRSEADELIRDIWDEIEFKFRKDDAAAMRRKAREYGVVYVARPGEPEETDATPAAPAEGTK
jgi:hypothetical protein